MTRSLRFAVVFVTAAVLGSVPVLMLARAMLRGPETTGFPVPLLLPAMGWLAPFAIGLVFTWWRDRELTPAWGAALGFISVCAYALAAAIYFVAVGRVDLSFIIVRFIFALPSAVAAAALAAFAVWLASKILGEDRRDDAPERR